MKELKCSNCGANEWIEKAGIRQCAFCGSKFQLTEGDVTMKQSTISINSDVERLLKKCEAEPRKARKYAELILDIDPTNKDVYKYL